MHLYWLYFVIGAYVDARRKTGKKVMLLLYITFRSTAGCAGAENLKLCKYKNHIWSYLFKTFEVKTLEWAMRSDQVFHHIVWPTLHMTEYWHFFRPNISIAVHNGNAARLSGTFPLMQTHFLMPYKILLLNKFHNRYCNRLICKPVKCVQWP